MREPELAVVFSPREWANRVVRHITDHGGGRVRMRLIDGRVALEEEYDVLLAEDITSFLDARFVQELRRSGRLILAAYDPDEPAGKEGLLKLGVSEVVECTASSEEFVRKIGVLVAEAALDLDERAGELGTPRDRGGAPAGPDRPWGVVTAVGAPPGGCGATEVAIALARTARLRGESSVVVDADDAAPSVAQRLGLPLTPNVRTAVDAFFHDSGRVTEALVPLARGGFEVLPGIATAADWTHLRPAEVVDVVAELAAIRDHVVVNVGSHLEDLTSFGAPDRYGLTRSLIRAADSVVAVSAPTPLGVTRLLAWIAELRAISPGKPVHVVVNRAPESAFERGELTEEIRRVFVPTSLTFIPDDRHVGKAAWRGELVVSGAFVKGVARLAETALPRLAPRSPAPRRKGVLSR